MSESNLSINRQLDAICDEFEAQWSPDAKLDLSNLLARVDRSLQSQLLGMLLEIDVELRTKSGQTIDIQLYRELGETCVMKVQQLLDERSGSEGLAANLEPPASGSKGDETAGSVSLSDTTAEFKIDPQTRLVPGGDFGRYKIIGLLGGGGMGSVYKAEDMLLERHVALKVPHIAFKTEQEKEELIKRFQREAKAMATLNHPNLCQVYDVGRINDVNYITMALVEGQPLSDRIRQEPELDLSSALHICRKMALALHKAHQKHVIHRDLKPANIMLTGDEEPIVIDFGLARRALQQQSEMDTSAGRLVGTLAYMSPEQGRGETDYLTHSTDIFSLGVILFRMLAGRLPFQAKGMAVLSQILMEEAPRPSSIRSELPSSVDNLCQKLLAKNPNDRFETMLDVALAVEAIAEARVHRADVQRVERKTLCPDHKYDIFISYSPADDELSRERETSWVSAMIQDLEWRICQLHGIMNEISVVHASDPIHESKTERPRHLDSKIIVIVNSPGYSNSIWPMPELEDFRKTVAAKIDQGDVLVVEKDRPLDEGRNRELSSLNPIRFWSQTVDGVVEVLSSRENKSRYLGKIDDLARKLVTRLHCEHNRVGEDRTDIDNETSTELQVVYLAEVTDDLDPVREEVRRYLEQTGVDVYPKVWFARDRDSFVKSVGDNLQSAQLYVQLLGTVIGKKPPDSEESYAQLQHRCAVAAGVRVLQWRGKDVRAETITDVAHHDLLFGPTVQCSAIQEFKREISRELDKLAQENESAQIHDNVDSFVFINVEQKDVKAADEICQILDQSGMCYAMPLHEGRPGEIRKDLEDNLIDCDALIIYYGEASGQWVREQLRHWRRVLHKRDKPVKALAIYEGPPDEKAPIGMRLPKMELLNCRHGLDHQKIQQFLGRLDHE